MTKKMLMLLLCATAYTHNKHFSVPALTPELVQEIYTLQKTDPASRHTFEITGQPGLRNTFNYYVETAAYTLNNLSLKNILLRGALSLFGATTLSYCCIAYFIYRVYNLIHKIGLWLSWNEEVTSHDIISEAQQYLKRTQMDLYLKEKNVTRRKAITYDNCLETIKKEETLLRLYLWLNTALKNRNMRLLFMYDEEKEKQIVYALSLLHEVGTLNEKRDEHSA